MTSVIISPLLRAEIFRYHGCVAFGPYRSSGKWCGKLVSVQQYLPHLKFLLVVSHFSLCRFLNISCSLNSLLQFIDHPFRIPWWVYPYGFSKNIGFLYNLTLLSIESNAPLVKSSRQIKSLITSKSLSYLKEQRHG